MFFSINVKLPFPEAGHEGQPLYYGDIQTNLPGFAHHFDDLQGNAEFGSVTLGEITTPMRADVSTIILFLLSDHHILTIFLVLGREQDLCHVNERQH